MATEEERRARRILEVSATAGPEEILTSSLALEPFGVRILKLVR